MINMRITTRHFAALKLAGKIAPEDNYRDTVLTEDDYRELMSAPAGGDLAGALTDAELLDQFALASVVPITSPDYPGALEARKVLRAELLARMKAPWKAAGR